MAVTTGCGGWASTEVRREWEVQYSYELCVLLQEKLEQTLWHVRLAVGISFPLLPKWKTREDGHDMS